MTDAEGAAPARSAIPQLLASAPMASAFTLATVGALFGTHLIVSLIGQPGYSAIVIGLCVIAVAILIVRRDEISLLRLMPISLLLFMIWLLITTFWSTSTALSLSGWLALAGPAVLAITVAHIRDTLQTVRATGDVLRVLLVGSLAIEILSGILLDLPIRFLRVAGNLAEGGPIQGLFGTRTQLGLVTVLALITFLVEWRTRSVRPSVALFSVSLAALLALFTASPIVLVLAFISGVATLLLAIVRRVPAHVRPGLQMAIAGALVVTAALVYALRRPIVYWLNAEPDFLRRSRLWNAALDMVDRRPVQGWGWFGSWSDQYLPFSLINFRTGHVNESAMNAFIDVLLQAGWVGAVLFVVLCGLALTRAWLTASERKSTVYTWPALILITLLANSVVESTVLNGFGWFLLVLCATRSSLARGWRTGFDGDTAEPPPALPHEELDPRTRPPG